MLKNYMKVAIRNLLRNKLYASISVIGLSIGIACCLLIFLYVQRELSFDSFHANGHDIYRMIHVESETSELAEGTTGTSNLLRDELKETFSDVKYACRILGSDEIVSYQEKSFNHLVVNVDQDFFSMFSFPLIYGNPTSILGDVGSIVITPEMSEKYFSEDDPIGKTLSIQLADSVYDFMVSGIIEPAPLNSSIQYDFIISTEALKYSIPERYLETWDIILFSTFVQLHPNTNVEALERNISSHIMNIAFKVKEGEYNISYKLQPIADIHLNPQYEGEMIATSDPIYSYILFAIAFAVLLIACINFTTLAVGRSRTRSREVGLRKVLGAQRFHIMKQFWGETLLLSAISLFIGLLLVELFLPAFNELAHMELSLDLFFNWNIILALIVLIMSTSFLAGFYPAVLLSKLIPMESIRGAFKPGGKNRLTQGLVIIQFTISILLIMGTLAISSQLDFINNAKLGYNKKYVITFPTGTEGEEALNLLERFRTALAGQTSVLDISGHAFGMGQSWLYLNIDGNGSQTVLIGEDITSPGYTSNVDQSSTYFYANFVDHHYIPTLGINVLEGRNFSEDHPSDKGGAIIINRMAAEMMGLQNPIGEKLPRGFQDATIIGVVENFHFYPLHRKIDPLVLHMAGRGNISSVREIAVHIKKDNMPATLTLLENSWKRISGGSPFEYRFLEQSVKEQYTNENRWQKIVNYSSIVSILITCLGLFGLTSLAVLKRTKEIAIRKVMGASTTYIMRLMTKEFMILVVVANIIAWPIAYYSMNRWLGNFAYRTNIGITIFILAGLSVLVIALLTVSYQASKAARANPIKAIQHE